MRTYLAAFILVPVISFSAFDYDRLMVDRQGTTPTSYMRTLAIVGAVAPNTCYQLEGTSLVSGGFCTPVDRQIPRASKHVPKVVVDGQWNYAKQVAGGDANILGGFQTYETDTDNFIIPVVQATKESLAFYGAKLISAGDSIVFETQVDLPITHVEVGDQYFSDYLMKEEHGGGFYVEYHDRPHFHLGLDSKAGGFLVLGKLEGTGSLVLTGFRIPEGSGVYTPPNVIHTDAALTGNWLVVYSIADNFSTALLRTKSGCLVTVSGRDVASSPL